MKAFPAKLKIEVQDGDLSYGWHDVYVAEDIDYWLKDLQKILREMSSDQTVLQHGNEARKILQMLDQSLRSGYAESFSANAEDDDEFVTKMQKVVKDYADTHPGVITLPCEKHHRLPCWECHGQNLVGVPVQRS